MVGCAGSLLGLAWPQSPIDNPRHIQNPYPDSRRPRQSPIANRQSPWFSQNPYPGDRCRAGGRGKNPYPDSRRPRQSTIANRQSLWFSQNPYPADRCRAGGRGKNPYPDSRALSLIDNRQSPIDNPLGSARIPTRLTAVAQAAEERIPTQTPADPAMDNRQSSIDNPPGSARIPTRLTALPRKGGKNPYPDSRRPQQSTIDNRQSPIDNPLGSAGRVTALPRKGGKSGLLRAGCQVTPGRREPTESATETYRPSGFVPEG